MSPRAAAAAVARGAAATVHAPTRTRTPLRPAPARRRSGAAARPRTGAIARPRFDPVTVLDRILRGPLYIAIVGVLLAGIVFFNVGVLELNHGIARTDIRAADLKRENAALTLQVARLGSSERIQQMALSHNLVLPQPGDVRYLRATPQDAARALRVMTPPDSSSAAAALTTVVSQQSGQAQSIAGAPAQTAPISALSPTAAGAPSAATTTVTTPTTPAPTTATPASATTAQTTP